MKKLLSSLIAVGVICVASVTSVNAGVLAGTLTTPGGALSGTTNVFLITTNRINISQIQLSSTATGVAQFFDSDSTNAPFFGMFYTNNTWVTRLSYPTNLVTSFIGQNGFTNWYTNSYQYYYYSTNGPNTNQLAPMGAVAFGANIPTTINVDMLCERGLTIQTSTNVNYIIYYNSGQ